MILTISTHYVACLVDWDKDGERSYPFLHQPHVLY